MLGKAEMDLREFKEKSIKNNFDFDQYRHEEEIKFKLEEVEE
jgi:hypothetical protein